jgi:hypothetical protein
MMAIHTRHIIPAVIGFLLCSCAWTTGNPKILNPTIIQAIQAENATMAAVEDSLGPPDKKVNSAANEETWEYSRTSYYMIAAYWEMQRDILKIQFSNGKVMYIKQGYLGHEGLSLWPSPEEKY